MPIDWLPGLRVQIMAVWAPTFSSLHFFVASIRLPILFRWVRAQHQLDITKNCLAALHCALLRGYHGMHHNFSDRKWHGGSPRSGANICSASKRNLMNMLLLILVETQRSASFTRRPLRLIMRHTKCNRFTSWERGSSGERRTRPCTFSWENILNSFRSFIVPVSRSDFFWMTGKCGKFSCSSKSTD